MKFAFVVGSPRSGTTMVGKLLGSSPRIFNPGEYFGFYVASAIVPSFMIRVPSSSRDEYLSSLEQHAIAFAEQSALEAGAAVFCDATPWNMRIISRLESLLSGCVYVLCIRHAAGIVASLAASRRAGYVWAGENFTDRIALFVDSYSRVDQLPASRTIIFDYDAFCTAPERVLSSFSRSSVHILGGEPSDYDLAVLTQRHAPNTNSAAPIGVIETNGALRFRPRPSYDLRSFNAEQIKSLDAATADMRSRIRERLETAT